MSVFKAQQIFPIHSSGLCYPGNHINSYWQREEPSGIRIQYEESQHHFPPDECDATLNALFHYFRTMTRGKAHDTFYLSKCSGKSRFALSSFELCTDDMFASGVKTGSQYVITSAVIIGRTQVANGFVENLISIRMFRAEHLLSP